MTRWSDAPTHEGLWWLRAADDAEPVRVSSMWRDSEGALHFMVEYMGTEDTTHEHDTPGQWRPIFGPVPHLDARDPDPTDPGVPGERVVRLG